MFKKTYFIIIPIGLGIIGGLILCYEFYSYVPATSRSRNLALSILAYLISIIIPSIISKNILIKNDYKNRVMLSISSLSSLTIVDELNFWNNNRFPMKDWASNPKDMFLLTAIQLTFGLILLLIINIRIKNTPNIN